MKKSKNTNRILAAMLTLALLLSCCPMTPLQISAATTTSASATTTSGTCGENLTWTLDADGTLTISGTGPMANYSESELSSNPFAPWYSNRSVVKTVVIENGVTTIGSYAFYDCTGLTSVTIGSSVISISNSAFEGCTGLTGILVAENNTAYCNDSYGVLFNKDKTTLLQAPGAIAGAYIIPNSVTSIGYGAFEDCTGLTNITIPNSVTGIANAAFRDCTGLTSITIPNSVTTIGNYVFYSCDSLTSATIPNSVTSIGYCAFEDCIGLTDITIPNSVTSIGSYAFYDCSSLTRIAIGNGVTSIGNNAFYRCVGLTGIWVDEDNKKYSSDSCGVLFNKDKTTLLQAPGTIAGVYTIPNNVTSISNYAFYSCDNLTSIAIPNSVTSIGNYAFRYCYDLTTVYYCGTQEQWDAISIGSNNSYLTDATRLSHNYQDCICVVCGAISCDAGIHMGGLATCQIKAKCTRCGAEYGAFGNHTYTDNADTTCNTEGCTYIRPAILYSGTCGENLTWTLDEAGTLTISGTGAMRMYNRFFSSSCAPWYSNRSSIKSVMIEKGVTSIGRDAFSQCTGLTSVTIPNSITFIGDSAFWYCTRLTSVTIPSSVTSVDSSAFHYCDSLTGIWVDENNKKFSSDNYGVLFNKDKTELIQAPGAITGAYTIPNSVTSIGERAFYDCNSLTGIWVDEDNEKYSSDSCGVLFNKDKTTLLQAPGAITDAYTIPNSVTTIDDDAFYYCSSLTSIAIPNSVTSIGDDAFFGCYKLATVIYCGTQPQWEAISIDVGNNNLTNALQYHNYENGVCVLCQNDQSTTIIGSGACGENLTWVLDATGTLTISGTGEMNNYGNSDTPWYTSRSFIKTVVLENGVTSIGNFAFYRCSNLTAITIANGVTSIGNYAFCECTDLAAITIPNSVASVGTWAFAYCKSLTSITIPDSVTSVGGYAFAHCPNLTSITISNSITTVSYALFYDCTSLTDITIPNSVTCIENAAFEDCTSLTSINIPNSVTSIGEHAFLRCTGLTGVTIGNSVTTINYSAFDNCTSLTNIIIPNSVTRIYDGVFSRCTSLTTVIYCGTQEQWDAISISSYNEPLTNATLQFHNYVDGVCAICQYTNLVKIAGASLVLQNNLAINYKVNKVLFEEYGFTNPYLVVEMNGVTTTLTDYYADGDKYVFSFSNIAPNQMNDTVSATLYATYDGTEYASATRDYSVAEYAYSMLAEYSCSMLVRSTNTELRTLLVDLLRYGAASQTYTNYRTDALADASLTAEQLQWGTSQDPALENVLNAKYETVQNPTAKWKGAGLYLEDAVTIRLQLETADITGLSVKVTTDNGQIWTIPASEFKKVDGESNRYYVYFSGLDAGQMRQDVYLTICRGDTPVSNTARYSISSYVYSKQNDSDATLAVLLKAMMKYGDAAYAYAN